MQLNQGESDREANRIMGTSKEEERIADNQQEEKQNDIVKEGRKGKSCKGYLYYSSSLKARHRNPRCIGIPRTLHKVPNYVVGQSEVDASKEGRTLLDFYYACAGYSVYTNVNDASINKQGTKTQLPVCLGLELLVDRKPTNADSPSAAPAHAHNREDVRELPRPRVQNRPAHSSGDDFLSRFTRNANLVASGVARNMRRVGNYMKETLEDVMYPYRRRPK